eukprot:899906-Rhodomonas_salina.1
MARLFYVVSGQSCVPFRHRASTRGRRDLGTERVAAGVCGIEVGEGAVAVPPAEPMLRTHKRPHAQAHAQAHKRTLTRTHRQKTRTNARTRTHTHTNNNKHTAGSVHTSMRTHTHARHALSQTAVSATHTPTLSS